MSTVNQKDRTRRGLRSRVSPRSLGQPPELAYGVGLHGASRAPWKTAARALYILRFLKASPVWPQNPNRVHV